MMPSYQRRKEGEIGLGNGSASLHEIRVTTPQRRFPASKFRPSLDSQTNVVQKIPCANVRGVQN